LNLKNTISGLSIIAAAGFFAASAFGQSAGPKLDAPSPFEMPEYNWGKTLDGKPWGSTSGIDVDPQGHVWAIGRCGANTCDGSMIAPVYELDLATGKPIKAIGAGLFAWPHGFAIDKQGNLYVSDGQTSKDGTKGQTVTKLDQNGKVLLVLGTPGKAGGGPGQLNEPCDVAIAPNGDIFVADGHSGGPNSKPDYITRIVHYSASGNSSTPGVRSERARASSAHRMRLRSTRREDCLWRIAATTGFWSSAKPASNWRNGNSSAVRLGSGSTRKTRCT
jgi:hypothetical protein